VSILGPKDAVVVASLLLVGCGSARRGEPLIGDRPVPTGELALGQRAFYATCHQCHPGGEQGIGPSLNNKPFPRWLIKSQVRSGAGAMPAFSPVEISGLELDAVTRYLVWLRSQEH
jgi:mono/diheme cytochrome c family protein